MSGASGNPHEQPLALPLSLPAPYRDLVVIGPPEGRRVRALRESVAARSWPAPRVLSYQQALTPGLLRAWVRPGSVVRLESPGEALDTEQALIRAGGGGEVDLAGGELAPSRAWWRGYAAALERIGGELALAPEHRLMQRPEHVLTMFDKAATHARLEAAAVPVPEALPDVTDADTLIRAARARGWNRIFVKAACGSSGAGVAALRWSGERVQALSTVRMSRGALYNSRRLLDYRGWAEVRALLDALAPGGLHAERWLPKRSASGSPADLRVVVIGGQARHVLLRVGSGPVTNLHLGARRGDVDSLRRALGEERWEQALRVAEAALAAFPGALYGGVDLLITPGGRLAVLEVNAFGDYHRGVLHGGLDTYAAELLALAGWC